MIDLTCCRSLDLSTFGDWIGAPELGAMGVRVGVVETVFASMNWLLCAVVLRDVVDLKSESVFLE